MSDHIPACLPWKQNPYSKGTDAFQQSWRNLTGYDFPPTCLIGRALRKVHVGNATITLVSPALEVQRWYLKILYGIQLDSHLVCQCYYKTVTDNVLLELLLSAIKKEREKRYFK